MKSDDRLKAIPMVTFTPPGKDMDLQVCDQPGVNACVARLLRFAQFTMALRHRREFWALTDQTPASA